MLEITSKPIKFLPIIAIVTIGFILTLPIVLHGFFNAQDLAYHLKWSKHFVEQFWSGDFYPRWLQNMNAGLGSPAFFFYAPIPYYFTSLFHPFFPDDSQGWYQLSLSISLASIGSGITAYFWLQSISNRTAAMIGAILYIILPYHLAVNLYWRFAFAEFWALVWLPLILYFTHKIISDRQKVYMIGLGVSYALLVMTHLPTLVTFGAVPVAYLFVMAGRRRIKPALIRLAIALLLAVGLSAIYWLPAMTTQANISMNFILEQGYLYTNNFLFANQAATYHNENLWIYLNFLVLFMSGLAIISFIIARQNRLTAVRKESTFWLAIAAFSVLMMLPIGKPIWQLVTVWQRIQFPWRFNTVLLVATTALLTLAFYSLSEFKLKKIKYLSLIFLLAVSLIVSNGIVIKQRLKPRPNYDPNRELQVSMEEAWEYRPRWVPKDVFQPEIVTQLSTKYNRVAITGGEGKLFIQQWKPRKIIFQTDSTTDINLTLGQFYYPGWTAKLKDESTIVSVQPSPQEGLLNVKIPPGNYEVIFSLNAGKEERLGIIISAISTAIAIGLFFWFQNGDRADGESRSPTISQPLVMQNK